MRLPFRALSFVLATVLAWPCSVQAVHYYVSVATQPGTTDTWHECNSVVELALIVSAVDPTSSHQIKICLRDWESARAISNDLLRQWYGSGLNVVFGPAARDDYETDYIHHLIGRAEAIEDGCLAGPPALVKRAEPLPGFLERWGPANAFGSLRWLEGGDVSDYPGGPGWAAGRELKIIKRIPRRPPPVPSVGEVPTIAPPEPAPLPVGVTLGPIGIVLTYLYDYDLKGRPVLVPLGARDSRYQLSPRAFAVRYRIANVLVRLMQGGQPPPASLPPLSLSSSTTSSSSSSTTSSSRSQPVQGVLSPGLELASSVSSTLRTSSSASPSSGPASLGCSCCPGGNHIQGRRGGGSGAGSCAQ